MKIYQAFDEVLGEVKLNAKFAKKVYLYTQRYIQESQEHISFFGDYAVGAEAITFKTRFANELFDDILGVALKDCMDARKKAPEIVLSRKVTSDTYSLVCFYLARRVILENSLPKKKLERLRHDLMLLFCYRTISALHNRYYQHLIPEKLSKAIKNRMPNQFILKRLGSWKRYMEYRADKVFDKDRKELNRLLSNSDESFLAVIVKTQGAIRGTMKSLYKVYLAAKGDDSNVSKRSIGISIDGEEEISDMTKDTTANTNKVLVHLANRTGFTDNRIIEAVCDEYISKYKPSEMKEMLLAIHTQMLMKGGSEVTSLVRDTLAFYAKVHTQMDPRKRTTKVDFMRHIRGVVTSSRSTDADLLSLRSRYTKLIQRATKKHNRAYVVKSRLSIMMYVLILSNSL